jgi:hypothetical protein
MTTLADLVIDEINTDALPSIGMLPTTEIKAQCLNIVYH